MDGAELRPRTEPRLRRDLGHRSRSQVPPRGRRPRASLPQLDAGPGRRHRRDRLVLPASERPLGPRPSLRAAARRHCGRPGPRRCGLDQPPVGARRGAAGADRHPRQDRRRLHARPRDRRVPVGEADDHAERDQRHRRRHRGGHRERRARLRRDGAGGVGLPHPHRRQGLGGRRLQPPSPTPCTCPCATVARA